VFNSVYAVYDLRCYCNEADHNTFGPEYLPGRFTGVAAGEVVELFSPGRQQKISWIQAEIISTDPIRIRILKMKPSYKDNHPEQYRSQQEARAQGF